MSRDKLTLSDVMQENIHLDEQLTNAQHMIDIQVEIINSLQTEIERLREEIATAAATLRLAANDATRSILRVVDEIEIKRILS